MSGRSRSQNQGIELQKLFLSENTGQQNVPRHVWDDGQVGLFLVLFLSPWAESHISA